MKKFRFMIAVFALVALCIFPTLTVRAAGEDLVWKAHNAGSGTYEAVEWSPGLGLFVAIGSPSDIIATSTDGENWDTSQRAVENNWWGDIVWSPELDKFVAVAGNGAHRVMTSEDGKNWTVHDAAEDNDWVAVTWSPELGKFVAVAINIDAANQVMVSTDGENWTAHPSAAAHNWEDVTWSPELGLFVAVNRSSATKGVMTSPDGENWTAHAVPSAGWGSVAWSSELGLFAAPVYDGSGSPGVITSTDGTSWTGHQGVPKFWQSVVWSPEQSLFVAVSYILDEIGGSPIMASSDGINWTALPGPGHENYWKDVTWSPQLGKFVAVGNNGTNRAMSTGSHITAPTAPLNLKASATDAHDIKLSWSAPNDHHEAVTGYKIERSVAGGDFEVLVADTKSKATTYADAGLKADTEYTYRVSAINAIGTSSPSNDAEATTPAASHHTSGSSAGGGVTPGSHASGGSREDTSKFTAPSAPFNLEATPMDQHRIHLAWREPSDHGGSSKEGHTSISGYKIERREANGSYTVVVANTSSTSTTYIDTKLDPDTEYIYRVSAINAIGTSGPSGAAEAMTRAFDWLCLILLILVILLAVALIVVSVLYRRQRLGRYGNA